MATAENVVNFKPFSPVYKAYRAWLTSLASSTLTTPKPLWALSCLNIALSPRLLGFFLWFSLSLWYILPPAHCTWLSAIPQVPTQMLYLWEALLDLQNLGQVFHFLPLRTSQGLWLQYLPPSYNCLLSCLYPLGHCKFYEKRNHVFLSAQHSTDIQEFKIQLSN